jgi:hypothetical protein
MLTVSQALSRIKGNLPHYCPQALIRQHCDELGFPYRQRTLTPVVTTYLFLQQILHGRVGGTPTAAGRPPTTRGYHAPAGCAVWAAAIRWLSTPSRGKSLTGCRRPTTPRCPRP